jgi:hypothetical protein
MVPFRYAGFYDVPRCIAVRHRGKLLLLESVFDEKIDDYSTHYSVYVLPDSVQDSIEKSSWKYFVPTGASPIGQISVASVKFDASKRLTLDPSCLDDLFSQENSE